MRKRKYATPLLVLSVASLVTYLGFSSWNLNSSAKKDFEINLDNSGKKVAYFGSRYFTSIEGALKAADFLDGKCEEDIFNYRVLMRYVQSVAHLSRFVSYNGLFAEDEAIWQKYVKAAVNRGTQVIRYSGEKELIEKCHYTLAWIYWHKQDFTKGREHIAALPSIANNIPEKIN